MPKCAPMWDNIFHLICEELHLTGHKHHNRLIKVNTIFWKHKIHQMIAEVLFHKAQKQSTSLNDRQSLTELTVFCVIAGQWGKPISLPCRLIPVQSQRVKNNSIRTDNYKSLKSWIARFTYIETNVNQRKFLSVITYHYSLYFWLSQGTHLVKR